MQQKTTIHYDLLQANATKTALEIEQLKIAGYRICVFGAGDIGSNKGFDFLTKECLVQVDFFCDNDEKKWGASVRGIPCISVSELEQQKEQVACIVFDQKHHIEIKKQLLNMGIAHLIPIDLVDLKLLLENLKHSMTSEHLALSEQIIDTPQVLNIHGKTFPKYKGINTGKNVVVMGSGNSLNYYETIENAIHIGVNSVSRFDKIKLDYLFWAHDWPSDRKDVDEFRNKILNYPCKKFFCFALIAHASLRDQYKNIENFEEFCYSRIWHIAVMKKSFRPKFAYNLSSEPLVMWPSIIFPAMQFALWTHPAKIYIAGCDLINEKIVEKKCNHYFHNYNHNDIPISNNLDAIRFTKALYRDYWEMFKDFAQTMYPEIEIISINPIGLKGLFKDIYTEGFLKNNDDL
jgi:hypothetical protein